MTKADYARAMAREPHDFVAIYGPFALRSAFQPIFRQLPNGRLRLEAFEGLVRPVKGGTPVSPFGFFQAILEEDRSFVDGLCRRLHIRNSVELARPKATLFLNFDPGLFDNPAAMAIEAVEVRRLAESVGLPPRQIVCEITEKKARDRRSLLSVTEDFRAHGFRIAVDDYGAEESDIARIELLQPDIVKFDGEWVNGYMETDAGIELLRDIVNRFRARRITTLFEGLEHAWQVDVAHALKVDLMQGYALAKPKSLPFDFNALFPEEDQGGPAPVLAQRADPPAAIAASGIEPARAQPPVGPIAAQIGAPVAATHAAPARKPFGRRGL